MLIGMGNLNMLLEEQPIQSLLFTTCLKHTALELNPVFAMKIWCLTL
jgi:hypothetical protein